MIKHEGSVISVWNSGVEKDETARKDENTMLKLHPSYQM